MKGQGPIAIALMILMIGLASAGYFLTSSIITTYNVRTGLKSRTIMKEIDKFEVFKIGIEKSLKYSLCQGVYETFKKNGFSSLDNIPTIDNIPVLRNGSNVYFTYNYFDDVKNSVANIFSEYTNQLKNVNGVVVPSGEIRIVDEDGLVEVFFHSDEKTTYSGFFYTIKDLTNFSAKVRTHFLDMFDLAIDMFIQNDKIKEKITEAINSCGYCSDEELGNMISDKIKTLEGKYNGVELVLNVENIKIAQNKVTAKVLVTIKDSDKCFFFDDSEVRYDKLPFVFYIISEKNI